MSKVKSNNDGISIRQRGENSYEYRFDIGFVNGKRRQLSKSGFKTEDEAIVAGKEAKKAYENGGQPFEPKDISYSDYLDEWLQKSKQILAYNTIESYESIARLHIKPRIGHYKLASITLETLKRCINDIVDNNSFSKEHFRNILKVIKSSFRDACNEYDYIESNPSLGLCLPRRIRQLRCKTEKHMYTKEEIDQIIEEYKDDFPFVYAFILARMTGLRTGEVLALTWEKIDFDNNSILVNRSVHSVSKDPKGRWHLGPIKEKGEKTIPIGETLKELLLKLKNIQDMYKGVLGKKYKKYHLEDIKYKYNEFFDATIVETINKDYGNPMDFVFAREDGKYSGTDITKNKFNDINCLIGTDNCRFYDNRGTFATELSYDGIDIESVKDLLGHSDSKITKKYYIREQKNIKSKKMKEAINKAEEILVTDKMKEYFTK